MLQKKLHGCNISRGFGFAIYTDYDVDGDLPKDINLKTELTHNVGQWNENEVLISTFSAGDYDESGEYAEILRKNGLTEDDPTWDEEMAELICDDRQEDFQEDWLNHLE